MSTFETLRDTKTMLSTTYKRDGSGVDTPVSVAFDGERACVRSYSSAVVELAVSLDRRRHAPPVGDWASRALSLWRSFGSSVEAHALSTRRCWAFVSKMYARRICAPAAVAGRAMPWALRQLTTAASLSVRNPGAGLIDRVGVPVRVVFGWTGRMTGGAGCLVEVEVVRSGCRGSSRSRARRVGGRVGRRSRGRGAVRPGSRPR